ncbi:MAG: tetratricopeptide repeat-containing sensor histidine kinase [Bacteroidota bacterium]
MTENVQEGEDTFNQTSLLEAVKAMNDRAFTMLDSDLEGAEKLSQEVLKIISEESADEFLSEKSRALNTLSWCSFQKSDEILALSLAGEALGVALLAEDRQTHATALRYIGNIHRNMGDNTPALEYYVQALAIFQEITFKSGEAAVFTDIGSVYADSHDFDDAIASYARALAIFREIGDQSGEADVLSNMGEVFLKKSDTTSALEYFLKALELNRKTGNKQGEASTLCNIANLYSATGNYIEAIELYMQSISINREVGSKNGKIETLRNLGDIYANREFEGYDVGKALDYYTNSLFLAQTAGIKEMIYEAHEGLSKLYSQEGDFKKAYDHYKEYHRVKEEIFNEESDEKLLKLEVVYQVEQAKKQEDLMRLKNTELSELNTKLQLLYEETDRLNKHLQHANLELEILNSEKNEFLGIAAHDMKNPLAGIMLSTQFIKSYHEQISKEKIVAKVEAIELIAIRMNSIITNLLDINSIESGNINLHTETVNTNELLKEIAEEYIVKAEAKDIELDLDLPEEEYLLDTDKNIFTEIIENLVSNAVKFSPAETHVTLRLRKEKSVLAIEVADQGPGLTDEDKQKLFQKYTKLSAQPTAGENSTGLGLSIVKKLVEAMSGSIRCESEEGQGARFIVELPYVANTENMSIPNKNF